MTPSRATPRERPAADYPCGGATVKSDPDFDEILRALDARDTARWQ